MNKTIVKKILTSRNYLILIIATIGMLPVLVSAGGYYIFGDITTQMLPFVYETKRMFASGAPFWSWNTYFGDNFIASYAYYTAFNPFTWINCLFPYKYLGVGFTFVLYLKFLVCGYVSQKYLKKLGFDGQLSLFGCLLYTFSSWAITNLYFYMFMEPMILFPFLLIFIERFLAKEKHSYSGLAMATFVVVAVNYYFAAVNLIAAAMYFFCRLLYLFKDKRKRLILTLQAGGCVCLGTLCASAILIPVLLQLMGPFDESIDTTSMDIYRIADRIFWLFYPKTYDGRSFYLFLSSMWNSNSACVAVFGLLPTIMLFTKKGYGWVKWLTALMIVIYVTPLNGLFSLFTDQYYSRWAYALTLTLVICTLFYIKDYGMPRMRCAMWYCFVIYGAYYLFAGVSIYWLQQHDGHSVNAEIGKLMIDIIIIAVNAIALLMLCSGWLKGNGMNIAAVMAVTVCTALQFLSFSAIGANREFVKESVLLTETDYFTLGSDDFRREGDFKHRTNFTLLESEWWASNNFGLLCNRPSIQTFHSVENGKTLKWNDVVGFSEKRVFRPLYFTKSFEALMSVRDLVLATDGNADIHVNGSFKYKDGHFTVYESDHYIPLGFTYDHYILSDSILNYAKRDSTLDVPKVLLSALAIDEADEQELSPYLKRGGIDCNLSLDSLVAVRRAESCSSFIGHSRGFDAHINLDSAAVVFFSVVADPGYTACIDGEPTKIYETNLGFSSVIVPPGSHEIKFRYFTPGLKLGMIISAIGLYIVGFMFFKKL